MGKNLKISHNLDDIEFEEVLQKALDGITSDREQVKRYPEEVLNDVLDEHDSTLVKILDSLFNEIEEVIDEEEED